MMSFASLSFKAMILCYIPLLFLSSLYSCYTFDPTNSFVLLDDGRYAIFHGVNVVVKLPPFIPDTEKFDPYFSFNDEDISILKRLGINLVRLGIIWESIEYTEGQYNSTHLEKMSTIVSKLEKNGITVIVDAHQDMFSRLFCGEGAPKFYAEKMTYATDCNSNLLSRFFKLVTACIPLSTNNWRYNEDGLPDIEDCVAGSFIDYHKSPELMSIYDSFFKNENGVLDAFVNFWKFVAQKFKGRKNVLGYDLWNEPWASNLWRDIKSLIPGYVDNHILLDFYSKLDEGISQVDPDYTMLFEPIPFPDTFPLFGGHALGTFTQTPVSTNIRKQMFNVHSYCCAADQNICRDGEPKLADATGTCADFHDRKLKKNKQQASDIGIPIIITEFGACSSSKACYYEMIGFEKAADKYLTSWAYWMYKSFYDHTTTAAENEEGIFNDDGTIQKMKEKALSRTYIQYYQGIPLEVNFNDETNDFYASFKYDGNINESSVLYLNKNLNYKDGYNLKITDESGNKIEEINIEEKENYIYFKINRKVDENLVVKVSLNPL